MTERQGAPTLLTTVIGREADVAATIRLVSEHRLITLTGAGGCGKTRLALEVLDAIEFGWARFVDLTSVSTTTEVEAIVAVALNDAGTRVTDDLDLALAGRVPSSPRSLLVLDNCEHVVADAAAVATRVLGSCPDVTVLATSREPLGVAGEVTIRVPSLATPQAVQLFVERARLLTPDGEIDAADPVVHDICERLDGIPLAIELAAARTVSLSLREIAGALDDAMGLLTTGPRTALPRHRTLQASIEWSHELLTDAEAALLRRMTEFGGGATLEAIAHVCVLPDDPALLREDVVDVIHSLVAKSLVLVERAGQHGATRFRMLETVRQFATAKISTDESSQVARSHRAYYRRLLAGADASAEGNEQVTWQRKIVEELDNIRRALQTAEIAAQHDELAALVVAMGTTWALHGRYREQRSWLEIVVERAAADGPWTADAHYHLGNAIITNDPLRARDHLERAVAAYQAEGRELAAGWALTELSAAYSMVGDDHRARMAYEEVRAIADRSDPVLAYYVRFHECFGALWTGDVARAAALVDEVATRETSVSHHRVWAQLAVANVRLHQGRIGEALDLLRQAEDAVEPHDGQARLMLRPSLAMALLQAGEPGERITELLGQAAAAADGFSYCFEPDEIAGLLWVRDHPSDPSEAIRLVERAETTRRQVNDGAACLVLSSVIDVRLAAGDVAGAREAIDRLCHQPPSDGGSVLPARGRVRLASLALAEEDEETASVALAAALPVFVEHGDLRGIIECLELEAVLASGTSVADGVEAAHMLEGAAALRRATKLRFEPPFHRRLVDGVRRPGPGPGTSVAATAAETGWAALTPAERSVAALLTEGLTNAQIGERLYISRHTVDSHLRHVFAKLEVRTRSEAAAVAVRESRADEGSMA